MNKEKINEYLEKIKNNKYLEKIVSKSSLIIGGVLIIGLLIGSVGSTSYYLNIVNSKEETIFKLNQQVNKFSKDNKNLTEESNDLKHKLTVAQNRLDEAKPWFEMKEEDRKIKEAEVQAQKEKAEAEEKVMREQEEAEEKAKKEAEEKAKVEAAEAKRLAKEAEEKKGYDTGVTYDQLARTPDDFLMQKIKFKGKVIQVMEGSEETQIRLAVNNDSNNVILCVIPKELTKNNRVLDNDQITIMGLSLGLYTYQSTMGGEITIPYMVVDKFER